MAVENPRILLVIVRDYDYCNICSVLQIPAGHDSEEDVRDFWKWYSSRLNAAIPRLSVWKRLCKQIEENDHLRKNLPKLSPERAKLWHEVMEMKNDRNATVNTLPKEIHSVANAICREFDVEPCGSGVDMNWCGIQANFQVKGPLLTKWLIEAKGYTAVEFVET